MNVHRFSNSIVIFFWILEHQNLFKKKFANNCFFIGFRTLKPMRTRKLYRISIRHGLTVYLKDPVKDTITICNSIWFPKTTMSNLSRLAWSLNPVCFALTFFPRLCGSIGCHFKHFFDIICLFPFCRCRTTWGPTSSTRNPTTKP